MIVVMLDTGSCDDFTLQWTQAVVMLYASMGTDGVALYASVDTGGCGALHFSGHKQL